jgi:hypothetical protein
VIWSILKSFLAAKTAGVAVVMNALGEDWPQFLLNRPGLMRQ